MIDAACPVSEVTRIRPEAYLMWLDAPELAAAARPGQFFMVRCGPQNLLRRPLSLHRLGRGSRAGQIALLFQVLGQGTAWLAERHPGDIVDVLGPLGHGFRLGPQGPVLAAAGGMGVAPLVGLAEETSRRGLDVTLLMGARTVGLHLSLSFLPEGVKVVLATDDGSVGLKGRLTDVLARFLPGHQQVFACGPDAMYRGLHALLGDHPQLASAQVSTEARMGCGTGLCLGCSLPTRNGMKRVCKEGPVFELGELVF